MRELLIVLKREFVERVRSKSFLLSTILTPLFMLAVVLGPQLLRQMRSEGTFDVAVVDATGNALGQQVAATLQPANADESERRFVVHPIAAEIGSVRDSLNALVESEAIDGYLYLPSDVATGGSAELRTKGLAPSSVQRQLESAVSMAVQGERLRTVGLEPTQLAALLQPVKVDAVRLTTGGGEEHSMAGMLFGMVVAFFLYFLLVLYGAQVMHSVQEEKTNRISEVLVSSIRAPQLMLGKVLGVGCAALLQVGIWAVFAWAILANPQVLGGFGLPSTGNIASGLLNSTSPGMLVGVLFYMIFGFFIYATIFAAVGAAAASTEDAQRFTFAVLMPLILPMILADSIISAPGDTLAVVLSWVPLTSPLVMPMRMGSGATTPLEIGGTLVVLFLTVLAVAWLAGKIYRVGILATGKRASLRDIGRWLRMA